MKEETTPKIEYRARVHEFELPGGWIVLAGKSDADNELLSLKMARPDDRWFHVRGISGSHVILRVKPGEAPDLKTLKQAAAIAAYHSKARTGGMQNRVPSTSAKRPFSRSDLPYLKNTKKVLKRDYTRNSSAQSGYHPEGRKRINQCVKKRLVDFL
jgi:predicted ribosome quality control (RQC) complex YloA/Tae2 family protein